MAIECIRCRRSRPSFDDHKLCTQCRVAAGQCLLDTSNPCSVCEVWPVKTWNKLRKALGDAKTRAVQQGKLHWTSAFSQIEAWITNRPAPPIQAAMQPLAMQMTAMPSMVPPSTMTARPNQLGL